MVSVIIPIYKVEKYLRECVDSVLNQTYDDLEIILVDDGSPDNCGKICDDYAMKDKRIRVIHKKNGGLSDARNAGFLVASGEYCYFIDSDDYIKRNAIELLVTYIKRENADFVYFDSETLYERKGPHKYIETFRRKEKYPSAGGAESLYNHLKSDEYYSCVCLMFFKTDFLKKNRLIFRKGMLHEDQLFTPLAFVKANRTAHLHLPLYYRRMREGSIVTSHKTVKNAEGLFICAVKLAKEYSDSPVRSIKRKALCLSVKDKVDSFFNIYAELSAMNKKNSSDYLKTIKKLSKHFDYWNDMKLYIKCTFTSAYCLFKSIKREAMIKIIS